ncbi:MAG: hypothetical protein JKY54_07565 [Flavobacteriales bacterium]|nr:hypothetical protein [Flavobacteriales bacterium]
MVSILSCSSENRVNYEDLDIGFNHEIANYKLNGAPFNGIAVERFSEMRLEHHIKMGFEEKLLGFYLSGEKQREFNFQGGIKHGKSTMWWKDGTLLLEETYDKGDLNGTVNRYHPDGSVIETKTYVQGILEIQSDSVSE